MDLKHLSFSSKCDIEHLKDMLIYFDTTLPWKSMSPNEFIAYFKKIKKRIKIQEIETENKKRMLELLELYLLSHFLLGKNPAGWIGEELARNINAASYFAGLPCHDDLISLKEKGRWQRVPILVTSGDIAVIRWFIAGFLEESATEPAPLFPDWARKLMDDSFLQGIDIAAFQARNQSKKNSGALVYYPVAFVGNSQQFKGKSASLSMALNFRALLEDRFISPHLVCTGSISDDGYIHRVGGLSSKLKTTQLDKEYQGLICSVSNKISSDMETNDLIQVNHIDQAWMMVCLHEKGNHRQLVLFNACMKDPETFVNHLESIEFSWLEWSMENMNLDRIVAQICSDTSLLKIFIQKFERLVRSFQLDIADSVASTVSPASLEKMKATALSLFLRWCTANLALGNHLGHTDTTLRWKAEGENAVKDVPDMDIRINFYNNALVGAHNRYDFFPDLDWNIKKLLIFLEKRYKLHCQYGCTLDLATGKFYGTLAQHFGFCGPEYIDQVEKFSYMARKALGEQSNCPEFITDWERQYMYLTYARLDANRMEEAEHSLNISMGTNNVKEIFTCIDKLSPWQLALFCRFVSTVNALNMKKNIFESLLPLIPKKIKHQHPWQLITFNLGKIACDLGKKEDAAKLWEQSCEICFAKDSGPTIQVMALMPLSFLETPGKKEHRYRDSTVETRIKNAAKHLNKKHFDFLKTSSFKDALCYVNAYTGKVFPFSYR